MLQSKKPASIPSFIFHCNLTIVHISILAIVLLLAGGWFGAHVANANSRSDVARASRRNNLIDVDGIIYPYTAAGIQAAINDVPTPAGTGGAVMLPAAEIPLGSTGLTLRKHVCLIGISSDVTWLTYNGRGSAIRFPPGMEDSCLKHATVALGNGAGANAIGISLQGNYSRGLPTIYNKIEDVSIWTGAIRPGQIGMDLADLSQPQPAPSGVQLSWFNTIKIVNFGQPIVVNGQEGNFWNGIHIIGFSSVAVNDASNDDFWQLRISGATASPSAKGFQEAGVLNQIHLTCDFGTGAQSCINDLGEKNMWNVSALTPVGAVASSSFLHEVGARAGNIPSRFQVSSLAITGASSTVRSGSPH
jgi:hypothetical protein